MARILLVDDNDFIRSLFVTHLENILEDVEIVEEANGQRTVDRLKQDQNFDIIFCDHNMPLMTGGEVYQWMIKNEVKIPFLLCTSEPIELIKDFEGFHHQHSNNYYLQKPCGVNEVEVALKTCLNNIEVPTTMSEYKKIRIIYFLRSNKALCDIYVKLSEEKYVKIIKADRRYHRKDIEKYVDKNQQHLYITNRDYDQFSSCLDSTPFLSLDTEGMSAEELEDNIISTHEMTHQLLVSVGMTATVVDAAAKNVDNIIDSINKIPNIKKILLKARDKNNYLYDHSYTTSIIATAVAKNLDWSTPQTNTKLILTALLHDLMIEDTEVAYLMDTRSEQLDYLPREKRQRYKVQAEKMASLIDQNEDNFPMDVSKLIRLHHKKLQEPEDFFDGQITPLAAIFLLSHFYVAELYKIQFDEEVNEALLKELEVKFSQGVFESIVLAFRKCF